MSIRENIIAQQRKYLWILWAPIFVFILVMQIEYIDSYLNSMNKGILVLLLIIAYAFFFGKVMDKIKCPNCGFVFALTSLKEKRKFQINVCPHCAIKLDGESNT